MICEAVGYPSAPKIIQQWIRIASAAVAEGVNRSAVSCQDWRLTEGRICLAQKRNDVISTADRYSLKGSERNVVGAAVIVLRDQLEVARRSGAVRKTKLLKIAANLLHRAAQHGGEVSVVSGGDGNLNFKLSNVCSGTRRRVLQPQVINHGRLSVNGLEFDELVGYLRQAGLPNGGSRIVEQLSWMKGRTVAANARV